MLRTVIAIIIVSIGASAQPQKKALSPTETVISFYRALKEKHYVEGFRHSVYRSAVEGLAPAELKDLEPDFARTASVIPDKIEPRDEKINGQTATVSLQFAGAGETQQVALVQVAGEWLVGDQDTLAMVNSQGRAFFFNSRMLVNESETFEMLQQIIGAEIIYARKFQGVNAPLKELIRLGGVPKEIEDSVESGYYFDLKVSADGKSFFVTATPSEYGKTGRISFYADINGIRGEDLKGKLATVQSAFYQPK